jgi:hypothetical protein
MKQTLFLATFMVCAVAGFGRNSSSPGNNYTDTISSTTTVPDAQQLLADILRITGVQSNFELKQAKVLNLEATISHRKRYILYNPAYITQLNSISHTKWAAMVLIAHEVGHHLNGHTMHKGGSSPELELEADEFAGFVMYKLGATLWQSQEVMQYVAKPQATSTHPGRNDRLQAIAKGWNKAAAADTYKVKL